MSNLTSLNHKHSLRSSGRAVFHRHAMLTHVVLKPFNSSRPNTVRITVKSHLQTAVSQAFVCTIRTGSVGSTQALYSITFRGSGHPSCARVQTPVCGGQENCQDTKFLFLKWFKQTWLLQYSVKVLLLVMGMLSVQDSVCNVKASVVSLIYTGFVDKRIYSKCNSSVPFGSSFFLQRWYFTKQCLFLMFVKIT